jgi:predicted DNA-binding protein (UPF0251 family)
VFNLHRRRRGVRGRFPIQPNIGKKPKAERMSPHPESSSDPIHLDLAEAEVLRLQEQAGLKMGISRGTVWRLLASARMKVANSIFEGRPLILGLPEDTE